MITINKTPFEWSEGMSFADAVGLYSQTGHSSIEGHACLYHVNFTFVQQSVLETTLVSDGDELGILPVMTGG